MLVLLDCWVGLLARTIVKAYVLSLLPLVNAKRTEQARELVSSWSSSVLPSFAFSTLPSRWYGGSCHVARGAQNELSPLTSLSPIEQISLRPVSRISFWRVIAKSQNFHNTRLVVLKESCKHSKFSWAYGPSSRKRAHSLWQLFEFLTVTRTPLVSGLLRMGC